VTKAGFLFPGIFIAAPLAFGANTPKPQALQLKFQEIESRLWSLFNWICNLVNYFIVILKLKSSCK
jgi:hypothetical protein